MPGGARKDQTTTHKVEISVSCRTLAIGSLCGEVTTKPSLEAGRGIPPHCRVGAVARAIQDTQRRSNGQGKTPRGDKKGILPPPERRNPADTGRSPCALPINCTYNRIVRNRKLSKPEFRSLTTVLGIVSIFFKDLPTMGGDSTTEPGIVRSPTIKTIERLTIPPTAALAPMRHPRATPSAMMQTPIGWRRRLGAKWIFKKS